MVQNLKEYLKSNPLKGFQAVPQYFAAEDFLTFYFRDERCFAKRVDDVLTVFLATDSRELVGFKIKGVRHIVERAGTFGVLLNSDEVRMGLFFFVGAATTKDLAQLRWYTEIAKHAADVPLDRSLIS
jgi:hypothetical protein